MMALYAPLTKEDLSVALQGMEDRLDAKWDAKLDAKLQRFATKDDLKAFATKDDLKAFATKDDLKLLPSKEDFNRLAKSVARLDGDMHDVGYLLATQVATKQDMEKVMRFVDQGLKEMDEHRELRSSRGLLLDSVVEKVTDHERRLREIEGQN